MTAKNVLLALSPLLLHPSLALSSHTPSATISAGSITGTQCPHAPDTVVFRGIPYAEPPLGDLRFAPPVAYAGPYDNGQLNATQNPPACVQFSEADKEAGPSSEDCLFLNIYAPANATSSSALPVRVWLYGGSDLTGGISNPFYDGCNVGAHNTIMVSANYRLGALGFLYLQEAGFYGNQALKDQILALRWAKENIRAFGGDPNKIMLHGQSAGAEDAFDLATLPEAPQLFDAVALQSGAGSGTTLCTDAQKIGEAYAQALNCSSDSASCLRSIPAEDLVTAEPKLSILNTGFGHSTILDYSSVLTIDMGPCVGDDLLKVQPSEAGVRVPSIIGYAARDGDFFVATDPFFPSPLNISSNDYSSFLTQTFGARGAAAVEQHLPFSVFTNNTGTAKAPGFAAVSYVYTASQFMCPTYRALQGGARNGVPVYAYAFNHTPSCPWATGFTDRAIKFLGPTHTSEIPFVLGNVDGLPMPNGTCNFSAQEDMLSDFMLNAWTNMAEMRRPTNSNATWPRFAGRNATMGVTFNDVPVPGMLDFSVCELFDAINAAEVGEAGLGGGNSTSITGTIAHSSSGGALPPMQTGNAAAPVDSWKGGTGWTVLLASLGFAVIGATRL